MTRRLYVWMLALLACTTVRAAKQHQLAWVDYLGLTAAGAGNVIGDNLIASIAVVKEFFALAETSTIVTTAFSTN